MRVNEIKNYLNFNYSSIASSIKVALAWRGPACTTLVFGGVLLRVKSGMAGSERDKTGREIEARVFNYKRRRDALLMRSKRAGRWKRRTRTFSPTFLPFPVTLPLPFLSLSR